jgi:hypothetical protein
MFSLCVKQDLKKEKTRKALAQMNDYIKMNVKQIGMKGVDLIRLAQGTN